MEKEILTFNDLPQVVAQLRDEVMGMRAMLSRQQAESSKPVKENRHKPMTVDEAIEYTHIPRGTMYMKLEDGTIPATKPGRRWILYQVELDKWLEANRKNPIPLTDEEQNATILALPSKENILAEESALILQIRDLMERDRLYLQSELKISDVANALGTNSRYVSESIRNYEGCTFTQFINRCRVEHAEQILLKTPDKKVSAVSEESGFSNETTFFRTFKTIKGMTPREWLSSQKPDEAEE